MVHEVPLISALLLYEAVEVEVLLWTTRRTNNKEQLATSTSIIRNYNYKHLIKFLNINFIYFSSAFDVENHTLVCTIDFSTSTVLRTTRRTHNKEQLATSTSIISNYNYKHLIMFLNINFVYFSSAFDVENHTLVSNRLLILIALFSWSV
jgi:hypothetical protein